jgi:hypothetical protein
MNASTDIIRMIESKRMRWAGHVASMGDKRRAYKDLGRHGLGASAKIYLVHHANQDSSILQTAPPEIFWVSEE